MVILFRPRSLFLLLGSLSFDRFRISVADAERAVASDDCGLFLREPEARMKCKIKVRAGGKQTGSRENL